MSEIQGGCSNRGAASESFREVSPPFSAAPAHNTGHWGWEKPEFPESPTLPPPDSGQDCLLVILPPLQEAWGQPGGQQEGWEGAWEEWGGGGEDAIKDQAKASNQDGEAKTWGTVSFPTTHMEL